MPIIRPLPFLIFLIIWVEAKEAEHHSHEGSNNIKINQEFLDFTHSKKKEDGTRYGIEIDHEDRHHHLQFYYERTDTHTKPIVPKDLAVNKYTVKYQYKRDVASRVSLLYTTIDDNLMEETDGGKIYGIGYDYQGVGLHQYLSDYPHFNVYQSDLRYRLQVHGVRGTLEGKYIHLQDKNSNPFSQNAKPDYATFGVKLHTHYHGIHWGAGAYWGRRIFAVMKEGFGVQHHAMEFKESYTLGVGHHFGKRLSAHLRYSYHEAKEIVSRNDHVKVEAISINGIYRF